MDAIRLLPTPQRRDYGLLRLRVSQSTLDEYERYSKERFPNVPYQSSFISIPLVVDPDIDLAVCDYLGSA